MTLKIDRSAVLAAVIASQFPTAAPHLVARAVARLIAAGRAAKAWELRVTNEPMSEAEQEAGYERLKKRARDLAQMLADLAPTGNPVAAGRIGVELGGDCRGACAYLFVADLPGDGWESGKHRYAIHAGKQEG